MTELFQSFTLKHKIRTENKRLKVINWQRKYGSASVLPPDPLLHLLHLQDLQDLQQVHHSEPLHQPHRRPGIADELSAVVPSLDYRARRSVGVAAVAAAAAVVVVVSRIY